MNSRTILAICLVSLVGACVQTPYNKRVSRFDPHGVEQVWVAAGSFLRGTADIESIEAPDWVRQIMPSEQPQHRVTLSHGYWIDRYEVSNEAFARFAAAAGYDDPAYWSVAGWEWLQETRREKALPVDCVEPVPNDPRVCVTWFEAEAYANWRGARLPTEAEWEYAARGPESLVYPWGDDFDSKKTNILAEAGPERNDGFPNGGKSINGNPIGLKPIDSYPSGQSWIGAFNMSGNAMEWVHDWLDRDYYSLRETPDPRGPPRGRIKMEKGGWWGSNSAVARSAYHHFEDPPSYQDHHIGFRLVTDAATP